VKTVFAAIASAFVAEALIYRSASAEYSGAVETVLFILGAMGSVVLGFAAPNPRMAYCASLALFVPAISYSMLGYGFLEMGGFLHAFACGSFGLVCFTVVRRFRNRSPVCASNS
jgi:hypothetical protein